MGWLALSTCKFLLFLLLKGYVNTLIRHLKHVFVVRHVNHKVLYNYGFRIHLFGFDKYNKYERNYRFSVCGVL
jgi:hypothetical protein